MTTTEFGNLWLAARHGAEALLPDLDTRLLVPVDQGTRAAEARMAPRQVKRALDRCEAVVPSMEFTWVNGTASPSSRIVAS
jgi:hypothetical protein